VDAGSFARGKRDPLPRLLVLIIPIQLTTYFYKESHSDKSYLIQSHALAKFHINEYIF
jgi:hypothetical protein